MATPGLSFTELKSILAPNGMVTASNMEVSSEKYFHPGAPVPVSRAVPDAIVRARTPARAGGDDGACAIRPGGSFGKSGPGWIRTSDQGIMSPLL